MAAGEELLGIILCMMNTLLAVSGFILQRKSYKDNELLEPEMQKPEYLRPVWLLGIFLYIIACVPDVYAAMLLTEVLYSTLGCFRLMLMAVFGHVFLKELLGRRGVLGIAMCSLGSAICVWWGPTPDHPEATHSYMVHTRVPIYVTVSLGVLSVFLVIVHGDSLGFIQAGSKLYKFSLPFAVALACGIEKVFNLELAFVKRPENLLEPPVWSCMVISIGALGLMDFYLNMRAASRMNVQVFVPLSFAFGITTQLLQGLIVFQEFDDVSVAARVMTSFGCLLALFGALVIQSDATKAAEPFSPMPEDSLPHAGSVDLTAPITKEIDEVA